jgi:hypothetical protein
VSRIIEQGDIFFFYRPRVGTDAVDELTWAFVAEVAEQPEELHKELELTTYEARTRGIRGRPRRPSASARRRATSSRCGTRATKGRRESGCGRRNGPSTRLSCRSASEAGASPPSTILAFWTTRGPI